MAKHLPGLCVHERITGLALRYINMHTMNIRQRKHKANYGVFTETANRPLLN
jgi:hypothetical protein